MNQAKRFPNADSHHVWIPEAMLGTSQEQLIAKLNFYFTGRRRGDDIEVFMPLGWGMVAAGEGTYHLLDDQDRKRALITKEHPYSGTSGYALLWLRRYGVTVDKQWQEGEPFGWIQWKIVSSDLQLLREGEWHVIESDDPIDDHIAAIEEAVAWLMENKPEFDDPFAYWEE